LEGTRQENTGRANAARPRDLRKCSPGEYIVLDIVLLENTPRKVESPAASLKRSKENNQKALCVSGTHLAILFVVLRLSAACATSPGCALLLSTFGSVGPWSTYQN
jgi:hypothetical protein